jgi:hypothetical protein
VLQQNRGGTRDHSYIEVPNNMEMVQKELYSGSNKKEKKQHQMVSTCKPKKDESMTVTTRSNLPTH